MCINNNNDNNDNVNGEERNCNEMMWKIKCMFAIINIPSSISIYASIIVSLGTFNFLFLIEDEANVQQFFIFAIYLIMSLHFNVS